MLATSDDATNDCLFAENYRKALSGDVREARFIVAGKDWRWEGTLSAVQVARILGEELGEHNHGT